MDRHVPSPVRRMLTLPALLTIAALAGGGGCTALLTTILHVATDGKDVKAEYTEHGGLKHKTVAVVCRPVTSMDYRSPQVPSNLAKAVGYLIRQNVHDVKVVDARKIDDWMDKGVTRDPLEDFAKIGEAVQADVVIGIELADFSMYEGQTLYQGKAQMTVKVYDLKHGNGEPWEKVLPASLYPPEGPMPSADKSPSAFQRLLVGELAGEVARLFYAYDSSLTYAVGNKVLH